MMSNLLVGTETNAVFVELIENKEKAMTKKRNVGQSQRDSTGVKALACMLWPGFESGNCIWSLDFQE